jgi:hypothetical protein
MYYVLLEIDLSSIYDGMIGFPHGSMSHLESSFVRVPLSPPLVPTNPPPLGCIVERSLIGGGRAPAPPCSKVGGAGHDGWWGCDARLGAEARLCGGGASERLLQ